MKQNKTQQGRLWRLCAVPFSVRGDCLFLGFVFFSPCMNNVKGYWFLELILVQRSPEVASGLIHFQM